ncbi:MAG: hypothetical protein J7L26_07075 [Candidatus Aminicenantes bacterium]|nr:hypothetical protein [Candidatus Aminicenantes bacterium]
MSCLQEGWSHKLAIRKKKRENAARDKFPRAVMAGILSSLQSSDPVLD